jgi:hypothetical protein
MRERVVVIIPALNEEASLGNVLRGIPKGMVNEVVVVDNGSTDKTARVARGLGATVVSEPARGYGSACLAGIEYISKKYKNGSTIVVFMDGDHSDHPEEMERIVGPLKRYSYDMVVGTRTGDGVEKGAMGVHVKLGNLLVCRALSIVLRKRITDLGPFRAIRLSALRRLNMQERTFGWTVEMAVKSIHRGLMVKDVPVSYRKRAGRSKISGSLGAGLRTMISMLAAMMRHHLQALST